MNTAGLSIIDAMEAPDGFRPWFEGPSWNPWKAVLKGAFALPMTPQELITFGELAGGRAPPKKRVRELVTIAGRRCGKDSIASMLVVNAAALEQNHLGRLRPGEQAHVSLIACDRDQSRVVEGLTRAFFRNIPELGAMVTRETRLGLELNNGVSISIATNSYRQARGRTLLMAVLDECAFYRDEASASPDVELYRALTPSLWTLPGSMIVLISSPHKKSGLLWDEYKAHYGKDSDGVLVINASSLQLNPLLDPERLAEEREKDPQAAVSEIDGQFRDDVQNFVSREAVEACVTAGCYEIAPLPSVEYRAFVDPAGGSGLDSMTIALSHAESSGVAVLDAVRERKPPFSPDDCVEEFVQLLRAYRVTEVVGDRWGGAFVSEAFEKRGVRYVVSERVKSELYREFLPLLNSRRVELLDHQKMIVQLLSLDRKTTRGSGRDSIDHPQGDRNHDDLINSAAGSLVLSSRVGSGDFDLDEFMRAWSPTRPSHHEEAEEKRRRRDAELVR